MLISSPLRNKIQSINAIICALQGFAVLPLSYVSSLSLVFDVSDRVCDGITCERHWTCETEVFRPIVFV